MDHVEVGVHLSVVSGVPDLFGVSADVAAGPVIGEGGVSTLILASSAWVRAGTMLRVAGVEEPEGGHGTLRFVGMAGWRWLETVPFDTVQRASGPDAVIGLDGAWWLGSRIGLDAQLVGGAAIWAFRSDGVRPVMPDVRLSIGIIL